MAAGVTPEIREAWPTEDGRTLWSFSATSFEKAFDALIIEILRHAAVL